MCLRLYIRSLFSLHGQKLHAGVYFISITGREDSYCHNDQEENCLTNLYEIFHRSCLSLHYPEVCPK